MELSKALRSFRAAKDDAKEADALVALGRVHRALGRHADAVRHFEDALGIDRRLGRPGRVGASLVELGTEAWLLGEFDVARKRHRAAFKTYQTAGDVRGAAGAAVNLGVATLAAGDPGGAEPAFRAAVDLYAGAQDLPGLGDASTGLGSALARQGRYADAIRAHQAALDAFAQAEPTPQVRSGRGAALHNLGNVYAELGDLERAIGLYRRSRELVEAADLWQVDAAVAGLQLAAGRTGEAVATLQATLQSAPPDAADGLSLNLGTALVRDGKDRDATPLLERAAEARDAAVAAAALVALGDLDLARSPKAATKRYAAAVDRAPSAGDVRWRALHGRARAARALGADPLPDLRAAVTALEDGRRSLEGLDPWAARRFTAARADVYRDLIDALLSAGDGASALLYSERLRVAELQAGSAGDPAEQQLDALQNRTRLLESSLEEARGASNTERSAALEAKLAEARQAFSRTVDELRTTHADFDRLVRVDPTDIEAYQRDLGDDEVVVQPILLPDRLALLVFSSGPLIVVDVAVGEEELSGVLARVLKTMRSRRLQRPEKLLERLDQLGGWLWAPIADRLVGKATVIVAASGPLRYLPFQMLRHDGRFLVQDHDVVNVTNVGSLKRRGGEALRLASRSLLAVGNPDGTLPAADTEVDAIGALFPGGAVLHGADATLDAVRAGADGRRVLHLATHGVLDSAAPEASYIVLGGGERLAYLAIPGLYSALRDVGLVVLSACESGVPLSPEGGVEGGGLEISGLANQFRRAGVPRLVASLWQVGDDSTRELMVAFYEGLSEGRSPPRALAAAQRALLAGDRFAHPFHWAPFVLVGTPR